MITDISNQLRHRSDEFVFNSSILRIYDNYFIVSARTFKRFVEHVENPAKFETLPGAAAPMWNITHPWFSGQKPGFWQSFNYDKSKVFIFKFDYSWKFVQDLDCTPIDNSQDLRIVRLPQIDSKKTRILFIFNKMLSKDDPTFGNPQKCNPLQWWGHHILWSHEAEIDYSTPGVFKMVWHQQGAKPMMLAKSTCTEKNWGAWVTNDPTTTTETIHFSYSLVPKHLIYSFDAKNGDWSGTNVNPTEISSDIPILNNLCQIYGKERFFISLSTPAVELDQNTRTMPASKQVQRMGVGHIKFKWREFDTQLSIGKFIASFPNDVIKHPYFFYMAFVFIFNPQTAQITHMTHFFTLPDVTLFFPSGLEKLDNNNFVISGGVNDSQCVLVQMTSEQLENLFVKEFIPPSVSNPRIFEFKVFNG